MTTLTAEIVDDCVVLTQEIGYEKERKVVLLFSEVLIAAQALREHALTLTPPEIPVSK